VTGDDHARLGDRADDLVVFHENRAFMRLAEVPGSGIKRCAALALDPASGGFSCSVYELRPSICRSVERGDPSCRGELSTKADRPRRALVVLRARSLTPRP